MKTAEDEVKKVMEIRSERQADLISPVGICVSAVSNPMTLSKWLIGSGWLCPIGICER